MHENTDEARSKMMHELWTAREHRDALSRRMTEFEHAIWWLVGAIETSNITSGWNAEATARYAKIKELVAQ